MWTRYNIKNIIQYIFMWTVNARDIISLRTPGGDRFTEFVDALIRAEAFAGGISQTLISTNLRTNIGDQGVDTEVTQAMSSTFIDSPSTPTCWQYKAMGYADVSDTDLRNEIRKTSTKRKHIAYVHKLLQAGYRYYFCICDDMPATKRKDWQDILQKEISLINNSAPLAVVLTASHLAEWANSFPAIIIRFFRPELSDFLHLESWGNSITKLTSRYSEVIAWDSVKQRILEHIFFDNQCRSVNISIQGEAGVGKTRFVYEILLQILGLNRLVVYTKDTSATKIANVLANNSSLRAILVADECLPRTRMELIDILRGCTDRVRVISIDNSGERPSTGAEEPWLQRIPEDIVEEILERNFPSVLPDRLRAYVELSKGFVRLAADLCSRDLEIAAKSSFQPILPDIKAYLTIRLNDEERMIINAISLLSKVGFREDVKQELDALCLLLPIEKSKVLGVASRLKDAPGFISFAGRYLYITPEIIAKAAFENAWRYWIEPDPSSFLEKIPDQILESFLQRVSMSASEEVRRAVGEFFRGWAAKLKPSDLSDIDTVNRFVILSEANPEKYLLKLANLISTASVEDLLKIQGSYSGTRRSLVWLAEKMVRFDEFFNLSETILWNLALAETEHNLANNSSNVWKNLFCIFFSGTPISFAKRLEVLRKKLFETKGDLALELIHDAINKSFSMEGHRIVGNLLIAGRIPPEEWQPATEDEIRACTKLTLDLLIESSKSDDIRLRNGAMNIAIANIRTIILNGHIEMAKEVFSTGQIPEDFLVLLKSKLEDLLHYTFDYGASKIVHIDFARKEEVNQSDNINLNTGSTLPQEIQKWLSLIIPQDLHGQIIDIIGKTSWHHSFQNNQEVWHEKVLDIAKKLCEDTELLKPEINWLCSPQARGAWDLGIAMGEYDTQANCLNILLDELEKAGKASSLVSQYIVSLMINHPEYISTINNKIDAFEVHHPKLAYDLFTAGGELTHSLDRALRLVDQGKLSPELLGVFARGTWQNSLEIEQFQEVLKRLEKALDANNRVIAKIAMDFVDARLSNFNNASQQNVLEDQEIQNTIWDILDSVTKNALAETYTWKKVLLCMSRIDADRVIQIACLALVGKAFSLKDEAQSILVEMSSSLPELVVMRVGATILDEKYRWNFAVEKYRYLIRSLPLEAMKNWLRSVGVLGARQIARQLELPYLDQNGELVLPELTEFVLSEFDNDEETFQKFCIGGHNMQVYVGDMVDHNHREIEIAREFLTHPLRRVREWAEYEISSREQSAAYWLNVEEERMIAQ